MKKQEKKIQTSPKSGKKENNKVNKTWEAILKYQGAFTFVAPEFAL